MTIESGQSERSSPLAGDRPAWKRPYADDLADALAAFARLPRVIGSVGPKGPGPTLIVVGSIHGNEPAGALALLRLFEHFKRDASGLQGRLVGLAGNRQALARGRRYVATDLNRAWTPAHIAMVRTANGDLEAEDRELQELDREIARVFSEAEGKVYILDLHSTSGRGPAFTTLDDTLANRRMAFEIPVPHVLGIEEELAGTMLSYLVSRGITAIGFESGQHDDPESIHRAEAAVWVTLETTGVLERGVRPEAVEARQWLARDTGSHPEVVEVRHRHPVHPGDGFRMDPGFKNFQPIRAGQPLARRGDVRVTAPHAGLILMPLYQEQGEDGFFVIQEVRRFWLGVSAALRRLGFQRIIHWLPGIRRHPRRPGVFVVNPRVARFYAREIFHLLGYRREWERCGLVAMSPRDTVTASLP